MKNNRIYNNLRSSRCARAILAVLATLVTFGVTHACAANYYWDLNGAAPGAGGPSPNGNWDTTSANWTTDPTGASATAAETTATTDAIYFSAGSDATGTYIITNTGTVGTPTYAASVTALTGNPILSGGWLRFGNTSSNTATMLATTNGANLTLGQDTNTTLWVDNSTSGNNFLNFNPAAGTTITVNGLFTTTINSSTYKMYIRNNFPNGTGNVVFNSDLGADSFYMLPALQGGGIDTVYDTLTFNNTQSLTGVKFSVSGSGGTINLGSTVNTNPITVGGLAIASATANYTGAVINVNSAVTVSSGGTISIYSGGSLNVAGMLAGNSTTIGIKSAANTVGAMNILAGGIATVGTLGISGNSTVTDAGFLSGTTLTLGDTNNGTGMLVLGDTNGVGSATFTGLTGVGAGANAIVGGNASASTLTFSNASGNVATQGTALTLGGAGTNQNNLILYKTGAGTLVMSNANNTYSGGTILEYGGSTTGIKLAANGALGNGPLTVGTTNTGSNGARLQLAGYNQTVSALAGGSTGTRVIEAGATNGGATSTLTVNQSTDTAYSGILRDNYAAAGVLALIKNGAGQLNLSGANVSLTGGFAINQGTVGISALGVNYFNPASLTLGGGTLQLMGAASATSDALGFTLTDSTTSTVSVTNSSYTLRFGGQITGSGNLIKAGAGNLALGKNDNSATGNNFSGTVDVQNGWLDLRAADALGAPSLVTIENGARLTLSPQVGPGLVYNAVPVTLAAGAMLQSRLYTNTWPGTITLTGASMISALSATSPVTCGGTIATAGYGLTIGNSGDSGVVYLNGTVSGGGAVTVGSGTLAGNGTISGALTVQSTGTLEPGNNAIGMLTVGGTVALNGQTIMKITKDGGLTNDVVAAPGQSFNYGGTLIVTNLGATPLTNGDTFTLFLGGTHGGNFASIILPPLSGTNLVWNTNNLAVNGSLSVSVLSTLAGYPTNISFTASGNTLSVSWPDTHLGWILQSQTNALSTGLSTNWVDISGTESVTSTNLTISPAIPTEFFRLRHP